MARASRSRRAQAASDALPAHARHYQWLVRACARELTPATADRLKRYFKGHTTMLTYAILYLARTGFEWTGPDVARLAGVDRVSVRRATEQVEAARTDEGENGERVADWLTRLEGEVADYLAIQTGRLLHG